MSCTLFAQEKQSLPFALSGSIQSDILFPQEDAAIGASFYETSVLTNTYADLNLTSAYLDAGLGFACLKYPLPGFEPDFAGWGVPRLYITGKYKKLKLTAGDFYDQFGSGLIFRTYEDRGLGIDNSLRGARLSVELFDGIFIKALAGKQRRFWKHNDGYVWGGDLELNIDHWIRRLRENNTFLLLGASLVSKHEEDVLIATGDDSRLNLPANVAATDLRLRLQKGDYTFLAEYALKANDPSADNGYIYKRGNALFLSASYDQNGRSVLLQARRSDNMSFRSDRRRLLNSSFINRLPAFAMQHSYALATLYPYATQPDGEWAFQGAFSYLFKRETALGGKYGTSLKLNISHIRDIDKRYVIDGYSPADAESAAALKGTDGYASSFFKWGKTRYYQDINFGMDKKITADFKLSLMYMHLFYNQWAVRKHGDPLVNANIYVAEGKYRINKKMNIRTEAQYLHTKDDVGDWWFGLVELSLLPGWMFTLSDMYNAGATDIHYYKAMITCIYRSHFISFGYGRTKAGYDCSGGVCREMPASKGFALAYNYNFN
ncbi:MAG: DUF6029 family protein [Tannerella sp.]|nr:DUF6029 family protein [Tannerella sp.]